MVGAGKSTLTQLLCRLYPLPPDTIFLNGISIEKIKLSCLRSLISLVRRTLFYLARRFGTISLWG